VTIGVDYEVRQLALPLVREKAVAGPLRTRFRIEGNKCNRAQRQLHAMTLVLHPPAKRRLPKS
jgi:hypothetical protein